MLADLAGRPLLWHILQRATRIRPDVPVILATTGLERDDPLVAVATGLEVPVVRGSEDDVLGRFLLALREHPARWVVRICGDSPLFDPGHLARCLAVAERERADVVKFPDQMATLLQGGEVVSARALHWSREVAGDDSLAREHVTAYALRHAAQHPDLMRTVEIEPEAELSLDVKLSIDTAEDLALLQRLYAELWDEHGIVDLRAAARWLARQDT